MWRSTVPGFPRTNYKVFSCLLSKETIMQINKHIIPIAANNALDIERCIEMKKTKTAAAYDDCNSPIAQYFNVICLFRVFKLRVPSHLFYSLIFDCWDFHALRQFFSCVSFRSCYLVPPKLYLQASLFNVTKPLV